MAKDDYHVIVYQILAYLYIQLKAGEPVEPEMLMYDGGLFNINQIYWQYIMLNMLNQGFVTGYSVKKVWGNDVLISDLENTQITPAGIEYLCDNSFLAKAKQFLKDTKSIVPFI